MAFKSLLNQLSLSLVCIVSELILSAFDLDDQSARSSYLQNHPSQKLSPSKMDSNCWAVSASAYMLPSMSLDTLTSSLTWLPDGHWKLEIETGLVVTQLSSSLPNHNEYLDISFFSSTEQSLCTLSSAMSGVRNPSC